MAYATLDASTDGGIATITLDRPQVLNALNTATFDELEQVIQQLAADHEVRVLLLTGAGEKAFAAGADIRELQLLDGEAATRKSARGHAVFTLIATCRKPVLALINGFALGGGCELALACTLRIAAETARFGQPEVKLGLIPGYGGSQRLPRLVGRAAALKLLLTGEIISAAEALRIGLVDEVVPAAQLLERGQTLARSIAGNAPLAVQSCLDAVERGQDLPLADALALESTLFGRLFDTHDKQEGTTAFLEKRAPVWTGR